MIFLVTRGIFCWGILWKLNGKVCYETDKEIPLKSPAIFIRVLPSFTFSSYNFSSFFFFKP
jgi:hypothetical protein